MCGYRMFENVLFLVADSLRQDFVATNQTDTPAIDKLREGGVEFTRARSPGPGTSVSMPAVLSGAFPFTYGYKRINPNRPMIAPILSDKGYSTAGYHSNGWCDSSNGFNRGFDDFEYFINDQPNGLINNSGRRLLRELTSGFPNFPRLTELRRTSFGEYASRFLIQTLARAVPESRNDVTADASQLHGRALNWIDETTAPRFIWHQYMDTHFPYMPPNSEISSAKQLYLNYRMTRNRIADVSIIPQEQRSLLKLYREEIEYLDNELRKLLDKLEARGELSNTLIVFTADHGELLGEFGQFAHKSARLGSPLTHVPLIMWCEDFPKKKVREPVSLVDIVPTLYDYLNVPSPDGLDGQSLRPVIEKEETPITPAISETGHDPMNFDVPPSKDTTVVSVETDNGIIVGDWLHNNPPSSELDEYQLLNERREILDITDDSYTEASDMDNETKQRLQDLGYLE